MEAYHFIYLITGLLIGSIAAWVIAKMKYQKPDSSNQNLDELRADLKKEREENKTLSNQNVRLESDYKHIQENLKTQKEELTQIQQKFSAEFKNLANEIFEEKSKKFTTHNKENIDALLRPLGEKITGFEKKVDETNKESIARNSALKEQIIGLKDLNEKITKEAENLVRALKGDTKAQGNWGEFILESILEKSGLEKQREYFVQQSLTDEDGNRYQPDVVVKLPDKKSIIVDSKVSLVAYERYSNLDDKHEKEKEIKAHLLSIRTHIKGLSEKNYQNLYGVEGLDFVLMFIPVEPAFSLAVQKDGELFNDAYAKNIVIVSPATLIATLRTIASIWKQEYQNKNAFEIAKQAGGLYDKFVSFTNDLIKVGNALKTTQTSYQEAMNKLVDGRGNLIKKTEDIRKLGAKTSKNIEQNLLERSSNK